MLPGEEEPRGLASCLSAPYGLRGSAGRLAVPGARAGGDPGRAVSRHRYLARDLLELARPLARPPAPRPGEGDGRYITGTRAARGQADPDADGARPSPAGSASRLPAVRAAPRHRPPALPVREQAAGPVLRELAVRLVLLVYASDMLRLVASSTRVSWVELWPDSGQQVAAGFAPTGAPGRLLGWGLAVLPGAPPVPEPLRRAGTNEVRGRSGCRRGRPAALPLPLWEGAGRQSAGPVHALASLQHPAWAT